MLVFAFVFGLIGLSVCLVNWRAGILVCVLIGFLQDPLRKFIPGEPVILVVLVGVFVGATVIGMWRETGPLVLEPLIRWQEALKFRLLAFLVLVFVQSIISLLVYESAILTCVGLMSYLAPLVALSVTYSYFRNLNDFSLLISLYLFAAVLICVGVFLSFFGLNWRILQEVGSGLVIYDIGTVLKAHPGFMRASEIASWHLGAAVCFMIIVVNVKRDTRTSVIMGFLITMFVAAILMTGRRKMIMQILQFLVFYSVLLLYFKNAISGKLVVAIAAGAMAFWFGIEIIFPGGYGSQFELYAQRGATVFSDALGRMYQLGYSPIEWAINRVGFFGAGVGVASQGASMFGGGSQVIGGAGEGGLGKITVELGVPGLVLIFALSMGLFKYMLKILAYVAQQNDESFRIFAGIAAFLAANVPTFIVASQVYGDLFVLLILGWLLGLLLAVPRVAAEYNETVHRPLLRENPVIDRHIGNVVRY